MIHLLMGSVATHGVNWSQTATIVGGFATLMGVVLVIVGRISQNIRGEITRSVATLGQILDERLATKEEVAALKVQVAVLKERVDNVQAH